ncbi:MAG: DinB family protein [Propionibacteriales bacterium]|nr:DinB family protein [Propionibacteriales bacterium]
MESSTTAEERPQLERFLDQARAEVARTLDGLTDEQARRRLVPSLTTPLGLVTHLTFVEQAWFQVVLGGRTRAELGLPQDVDPTFVPAPGTTVASALAEYERVCAWSRETAAGYALDHVVEHHRMGAVSLRWIYVHMVRETSRHAGHADILREQLLSDC